MSVRTRRLSRRNFLLAAGAGTAASAAALVARNAVPTASPSTRSRPAGRGYHATGHTDNYYRTTKV